jgi:hypothetical protein
VKATVSTVLGATRHDESSQASSQRDDCIIKEGKNKKVRGLLNTEIKNIVMALFMFTK